MSLSVLAFASECLHVFIIVFIFVSLTYWQSVTEDYNMKVEMLLNVCWQSVLQGRWKYQMFSVWSMQWIGCNEEESTSVLFYWLYNFSPRGTLQADKKKTYIVSPSNTPDLTLYQAFGLGVRFEMGRGLLDSWENKSLCRGISRKGAVKPTGVCLNVHYKFDI